MTINLQTGAYIPPQNLPGARSADIQVGQKQSVQQQPAEIQLPAIGFGQPHPSDDPIAAAEQKRFQKVMDASQRIAANSYPLGDKSFTVFKDESGQYITRYTSLRDGRVTYIPEPRLLQQFENAQNKGASVVMLQA